MALAQDLQDNFKCSVFLSTELLDCKKIELMQLHTICDAIEQMQPKVNACFRPIFLHI